MFNTSNILACLYILGNMPMKTGPFVFLFSIFLEDKTFHTRLLLIESWLEVVKVQDFNMPVLGYLPMLYMLSLCPIVCTIVLYICSICSLSYYRSLRLICSICSTCLISCICSIIYRCLLYSIWYICSKCLICSIRNSKAIWERWWNSNLKVFFIVIYFPWPS